MSAINRGFFISAIISAIAVAVATFLYLPDSFSKLHGADAAITGDSHLADVDPRWVALGAVLVGIVLASAIQLLTGYFTETNRRPVKDVTESARTGPATVILSGI